MGGHIRKEMDSRVTHLVAQRCGGEKYQYAMTFRVPIVAASWVHDAWAMRSQFDYSAAETGVVVSSHINFNKSHVLIVTLKTVTSSLVFNPN